MVGQSIAHYQIVEKLGEGGMGVVYKARDRHLDRFVALKVLPAGAVADEDRRRRFVQEAKAASALHHPNIVGIHDIDCDGGVHFIAMEYVEGERLETLIGRKGLPADQVLRIAVQTADALAKAHAAGIIHRDLKPANIMVTGDGTVKVLDFGLAKLTERAAGGVDETDTLLPVSQEGTIVGTAFYMSPEQAQGRKVDARSDIFSFGAVLYEMVTGRRAFPGTSTVSVLGAILHKEPEPIPAAVPGELRRVIERCLRKDPERRFQHMEDLKVELEEMRLEASATAPAVQPVPSRWRRILPWAIAATLGALLAASVVYFRSDRGRPSGPPVRFSIEVPQRSLMPVLALSPDGGQLVYSAVDDGKRRLYVWPLDRQVAQPIPGTENGRNPIFSQDGQWLLFTDGTSWRKIRPSGGESSRLAAGAVLGGIAMGLDGSIISADASAGSGLVRASGSEAAAEVITRPRRDQGEFIHAIPQILPGGKGILFSVFRAGGGFGKHQTAVIAPGATVHRVVVDDGYAAAYARSGHLVFRRAGVLYAAPFDLNKLSVTGPASVVTEEMDPELQGRPFSVSSNGTLAYLRRDPEAGLRTPCWVDRQGKPEAITAAERQPLNWPALSPDGRHLALTRPEGARADIWVLDLVRGNLTRVTFEGNNHAPIWSPDGENLVVSSDREGPQASLWLVHADGSGKPQRLTSSVNHQDPGSFSPDGRLLAYGELGGGAEPNYSLWIVHLAEGNRVEPFLQSKFPAHSPAISPDGKWIAYTSYESGQAEVYVQRFPGGGGRYQVSIGGGGEPLWRPDGREIYYRNRDEMMAAAVTTEAGFSTSKPSLLFRGNYAPQAGFGRPNFDISRDGKRFLMMQPYDPPQKKPRQIEVVVNWFEELRRMTASAR